jgi:hypothetical protein
MAKRDNFNQQTIDILAKRVAFVCSNPDCKVSTIGPHTNNGKPLSIGIAAHITAAAVGGPRYDPDMAPLDRMSISNGIHLCSNCATVIDKDVDKFPVSLLNTWKQQAEDEALQKLGKSSLPESVSIPFIEPDLVWQSGGRWHRGYSEKNVEKAKKSALGIHDAIVDWELNWDYKLAIYNNSSKMAKNIRIEQIGDRKIQRIPTLERVNNLPPYAHLDLSGRYTEWIEGTSAEADDVLKHSIPKSAEGLQVLISYQDEVGKSYQTLTTISNGELTTIRKK